MFLDSINNVNDVVTAWNRFVEQQREDDLAAIISEEKLKPEETRRFLEKAFEDGEIKETGTDIDKIMPPVSRFGGGGNNRAAKKQTVISKLKDFFEKYFGVGTKFKADLTEVYTFDEPKFLMVAEGDEDCTRR